MLFSQTAPPDTVSPTVTARSPAPGSTAAPPTTAVTATFSEPINPATVTSNTVVLRNASNVVVASTLVYDAPSRTATLTPSAPLDVSATYTASVAGGNTGTVVRDLAGNPLAATVSWSFTTGLGCVSPANAVVAENCLPGNPPSEWEVNGAGDTSIQGFATEMSVNRGSTVVFKIDTSAAAYRLDIYRLGFYAGLGARKVATVTPSASLPQGQPNCLNDSATGLVDCGNWNASASWTVPATAVSGIYLARLVRTDTGGASHVVFIVRNDAATAKVAYKTSDTTWQAYNSYGGNSLYTGSPAGRAYKVSYNRPFTTRATQYSRAWLFGAEYPMVRWLEANGYDLTYMSGIDVERAPLMARNQRVLLSVGHDEYWSAGQRSSVEAARDAGVHLAFFSGNEMFWKTRWENSIDGSSDALSNARQLQGNAQRREDRPQPRLDRHVARPAIQPACGRWAAGEPAQWHDLQGQLLFVGDRYPGAGRVREPALVAQHERGRIACCARRSSACGSTSSSTSRRLR